MSERLADGTTFGSYTVQGIIAGGGMGQVYAASHEVYGSTVALKVLHASLHSDEGWRHRFNEEGLVGTQLKHPHVLSARELVEDGGRIALVLDLVPGGQTLEKVIAREFPQGLSIAQAAQVFLGIVQGIDYLHGKGIVHGDLKPENVMIEGDFRDPTSWVPKVTDFGTVALIAHPVMLDGRPAVVATPRYASPEHLLGVDQLEERSDIYSLGLILHYLLTGRHASSAKSVREAYERTLKPVPMVNLVDMPTDVVSVFQRSVAIDPDDRYAGCRDLGLAIRWILDTQGVQLDLDDIQADLATEVDEDRAKQQAESQRREAERAEAVKVEAPTEVDGSRTPVPASSASEPAAAVEAPAEEPADDGPSERQESEPEDRARRAAAAGGEHSEGSEASIPAIVFVSAVLAVLVMGVVMFYGWAG